MGLLNWFTRRPRPEVVESVWLTKAAKLRGIRNQIAQRWATDAAVVVLAHFPDMLTELEAMLQESAVGFERRGSVKGSELAARARERQSKDVLTALASALEFDRVPEAALARPVSLILAERHPLRDKDDLVQDFAGGVPCVLLVHVSLDDALMRLFAGEKTLGLLRSLGGKEDEPLAHPMIARSLRRAQERIAAQVVGDQPAGSAGDWLLKNVATEG